MIKKLELSKKEIKKFKNDYAEMNISTEVISNLLQPYHENNYPIIKEYCNFWWPTDKEKYGLTQVMLMMINLYAGNALQNKFGNHDFTFEGNRKYKNYLLEFDDLIIIVPNKRAVVLNEKFNEIILEKLVNFENAFAQFVMDYLCENYDNLSNHEKENISEMKKLLLINEDNKINFLLPKAQNKLRI